jgi:hypothetical protein
MIADGIVSSSIPVYKLSGDSYSIGFSYGSQDKENIRRVLSHHVDVAGWYGGVLVDVLSLIIDVGSFWGEDGLAELQGIADGAGVPVESLIYHNLQKYAVGACSHFAGCFLGSGEFCHGANIDVPVLLILRDSLTFHLQYRFPVGGIPYVIPGMAAVLMGIGGFNECGLFLSSSMLIDAAQPKQVSGKFHGKIVTDLLSSCGTIDEASRFLANVSGWGGWSIAVSSPREKRVIYAEYHGNKTMIDSVNNSFICSNHSRLFQVDNSKIPEHSRIRYERLNTLLNPNKITNNTSGNKIYFDPNKKINEIETILFDRHNHIKKTDSKFGTMNTILRVDHAVTLLADDKNNYAITLTNDAEQKKFTTTINTSDIFIK